MIVFTSSASISSGLNRFDLSGNNAVGYKSTGTTPVIYYSTNKGLTWNTSGLSLTNAIINSIAISGNNAILSGFNTGDSSGFLYYSTNAGSSWTLNTDPDLILTSISSTTVAISGTTAVLGINYSSGTRLLFYSTDSGVNWTQSTITGGAIPQDISKIVISGANAIFITNQYYLYNSTGNGANWTQKINNSGAGVFIFDVALSGNNVILAEASNISNSIDVGENWSDTPTTNFNIRSVGVSGNNGVAIGYNTTTFQTFI